MSHVLNQYKDRFGIPIAIRKVGKRASSKRLRINRLWWKAYVRDLIRPVEIKRAQNSPYTQDEGVI